MDKFHYSTLGSVQEKAAYLLTQEITAAINIADLDVVMQAKVGDVWLPVTGESEEHAIENAKEWLREKAGLTVEQVSNLINNLEPAKADGV